MTKVTLYLLSMQTNNWKYGIWQDFCNDISSILTQINLYLQLFQLFGSQD